MPVFAGTLAPQHEDVNHSLHKLPGSSASQLIPTDAGVLAAQVHFDLKSPNVLLGRDNVAKVADVGLAKILQKDYVSSLQSCGTFAWSVRAFGAPC